MALRNIRILGDEILKKQAKEAKEPINNAFADRDHV